jgi:hypothetical protein
MFSSHWHALFLCWSILAPLAAGGRRRAKEAVCASNLNRWGVIFHTFAEDNGGWFSEDLNWMGLSQPYCRENRLRLCPEAVKTGDEGAEIRLSHGGRPITQTGRSAAMD